MQYVALLFLISALSLSQPVFAQSWTDPISTPPSDNASSPVNISATSQVKAGGFGAASLSSASSAIVGGNLMVGANILPTDPVGVLSSGTYGDAYSKWFSIGRAFSAFPFSLSSTDYGVGTAWDGSGAFFGLTNSGTNKKDTVIGWGSSVPNPTDLIYKYNGAEVARMTSGGRLGIGTTTPASKLTVAGTIESLLGGVKFPDGTTQTTAAGGASQWTTSGANIYNANTGNVGIGTTAPSKMLDIRKALSEPYDVIYGGEASSNYGYSGNEVGLGIYNTDTTNNNYAIIALRAKDSHSTIVTTHSDLVFSSAASGDGSVERMRINGISGNVGIGTTTPASKLTVAGTIESLLGGVKFPDGTTQTTAASGGASQWTTSSTDIYSANTGNVGIGTTTPTQKLDVVGNINVSSGSAYMYNGAPVLIGQTAQNNYYFGNAGNLTGTGNSNVAGGFRALQANTSGLRNAAYGMGSLFSNTTGSNNAAHGYYALYGNTSGIYNTAQGSLALMNNTTASENTAQGYSALVMNSTGQRNTAQGAYALQQNTGSYNVAQGYRALYGNTSGTENVAQGSSALYTNTTGNNNTANGANALYSNTTGSNNSAHGSYALYSNTIGAGNTAQGLSSLRNNISGVDNTAQGRVALNNNTTGNYNTAQGAMALMGNTTGVSNTAQGVNSLAANNIGQYNSAQGAYSLSANLSGSANVAQGYQALNSNTTGNYNTASGYGALLSNTTGHYNTAYGNGAGANGYALQTMSQSTFLGDRAHSITDGVANSMALGSLARVTKSNQVVIGNTNVTETLLNGNVGVAKTAPAYPLDVNGTANATNVVGDTGTFSSIAATTFTYASDKNLKKNIIPLESSLPKILKLNGVSFNWKTDADKAKKSIGFIAQEVEKIFPEVVSGDKVKGVEYANLVAPLVEAVKEQQEIIGAQKSKIDSLEARLEKLEAKIK